MNNCTDAGELQQVDFNSLRHSEGWIARNDAFDGSSDIECQRHALPMVHGM